jgi:O-antigen/teichoic acid export membrane protein
LLEPRLKHLTSGRLLARNTVWNLIGQGAPLLVALFAIPMLIKGLGVDRFGVLTLVWMVIGYFSLFDLGLGRALTKLVAEKLGEERAQEIPAIVWTTLFMMLILGLAGAVVVGLLSSWLVYAVLKIPPLLQIEVLDAFHLLALSIPVVISTAALRGYLEAHQRFGLVNAVRIPMGVFTFLGPLIVLPFSKSLVFVVAILIIGRLIAWLAHLLLCFRVSPVLMHRIALQRSIVGGLMHFGMWMTVTNIVSPIMVYVDRFIIGSFISMAAVAYYVTPYEVITKLGLIPASLVAVLFPAFASTLAKDSARAVQLFERGAKSIFLSVFPLTLIAITLGHEGLDMWLGSEFAAKSTRVLQWLGVGVFISGMAQVPFALVQGAGRADLTAKFNLIELPLYLLMIWWMLKSYGIDGVAVTWVVRVALDTALLFWVSRRFLPAGAAVIRRMGLISMAAALVLMLGFLSMNIVAKGVFLSVALVGFALIAWFLILNPGDREFVHDRFKAIRILG